VTWRAVHPDTEEIAFTAAARKTRKKTGRRIRFALVRPLRDYLATLPAGDNPDAFIFPVAASAARTSTLSNQFREILVDAGLVAARTHEATGKGRSSARQTSDVSFHCFRHTATTMLKSAGVSDAVAMEIVGHDTPAISREYTHFSMDVLRAAMEKLPDVTADE
jgi:integrase